jgi:hypothetical protein
MNTFEKGTFGPEGGKYSGFFQPGADKPMPAGTRCPEKGNGSYELRRKPPEDADRPHRFID